MPVFFRDLMGADPRWFLKPCATGNNHGEEITKKARLIAWPVYSSIRREESGLHDPCDGIARIVQEVGRIDSDDYHGGRRERKCEREGGSV